MSVKMTEKEIDRFVRAFLDEYLVTPYGVVSRKAPTTDPRDP